MNAGIVENDSKPDTGEFATVSYSLSRFSFSIGIKSKFSLALIF